MRKEYWYDIKMFDYRKGENTFYGEEIDLMVHVKGNPVMFPNQAKQFFIKNYKTNGFRRFRLVKQDELQFTFTSEDGIYCVVSKEIKATNSDCLTSS